MSVPKKPCPQCKAMMTQGLSLLGLWRWECPSGHYERIPDEAKPPYPPKPELDANED